MAAWYASSVAHAAIAQFAISTAYTVGNLIRQLAAPAVGSERVFRCTTAGTSAGSEPSWNLGAGATTTSGTAVFTEVTGNTAYGWSAAAARIGLIAGRLGTNDVGYVSSDHAETQASALSIGATGTPGKIVSVNRAGSVPPVAADELAGASVTTTGASTLTLSSSGTTYFQGITFTCASSGTSSFTIVNLSGARAAFKDCAFVLGSASGQAMVVASSSSGSVDWDNCTLQVGATGSGIQSGNGKFTWLNTPSAIQGGTLPTTLFLSGQQGVIEVRNVDLSALNSGESLITAGSTQGPVSATFERCKIDAAVTLLSGTVAPSCNYEFFNCDSGATGYKTSVFRPQGSIVTETTITRTSGATDGTQKISHKLVSLSAISRHFPLVGIPLFLWNEDTGAPKTLTVEIISSASLNNDEVWIDVEYLGSTLTPLGSSIHDAPATTLATAAAQTTSTEAWDSSPATPQKQKLEVTFTPQMKGLIRATPKFGKASSTVYVCPEMTLT